MTFKELFENRTIDLRDPDDYIPHDVYGKAVDRAEKQAKESMTKVSKLIGITPKEAGRRKLDRTSTKTEPFALLWVNKDGNRTEIRGPYTGSSFGATVSVSSPRSGIVSVELPVNDVTKITKDMLISALKELEIKTKERGWSWNPPAKIKKLLS